MSSKTRLTKEEAFELFDQGLGPKDLVAREVSVSSAYYWHSQWKMAKGGEARMDQPERVSYLFGLFQGGAKMVDVIREAGKRGITDKEVFAAKREYDKAARMVTLSQKELEVITNSLSRIQQVLPSLLEDFDTLARRSVDVEWRQKNLEGRLGKANLEIKAELSQVERALKELQAAPAELLLRCLEKTICPNCQSKGVSLRLRCGACGTELAFPGVRKPYFVPSPR